MLFDQSLPPDAVVSKALFNLSTKTKGYGTRPSLPLAYINSNNVYGFFVDVGWGDIFDEVNAEDFIVLPSLLELISTLRMETEIRSGDMDIKCTMTACVALKEKRRGSRSSW